ncbi:hypothetical protein E2C01_049442 [Portunus trituberculatus]|uniref:Uncharacterized protein n=1 Tax=Portunus trituberculatus TaxID=210409 RepID=A0A5B7GDQ9_PORTR|nr:hypothetical protein [Portunus trituberculatus]
MADLSIDLTPVYSFRLPRAGYWQLPAISLCHPAMDGKKDFLPALTHRRWMFSPGLRGGSSILKSNGPALSMDVQKRSCDNDGTSYPRMPFLSHFLRLIPWVLTHADNTLCNIVYFTVTLHLTVAPHLTVWQAREVSILHNSPQPVDVDNARPPTCAITQLGLYRQPRSPTACWASPPHSWYQWVIACIARRRLLNTCCCMASIRCCNATTNSGAVVIYSSGQVQRQPDLFSLGQWDTAMWLLHRRTVCGVGALNEQRAAKVLGISAEDVLVLHQQLLQLHHLLASLLGGTTYFQVHHVWR